MQTTGAGAALGILEKSWERVFHTQMQLEPQDGTLRRPATGPCTGSSRALPAPGGIILPPHLVLGAPSTRVPRRAPCLPSPDPHQQGAGRLVGPQPRCPAPGGGRQDRCWAPSKAPGQLGGGCGCQLCLLGAGGPFWSLYLWMMAADGLGPKPQTGSAQAPRAAYLLVLGPPVEVRFSIHVQQQQVTEEGDLGAAGLSCAQTHPPGLPPTRPDTGGPAVPERAGRMLAHALHTHHAQPGCSRAQRDKRGDEPKFPCLRDGVEP